MNSVLPRLMAIVGPTASGKTAIADEIAKLIPVEIISCDSMQAYRDMPIVTQAPPLVSHDRVSDRSANADETSGGEAPLRAPQRGAHTSVHLVSFLDPSEEYSAARFREEAEPLVRQTLKAGKLPLICGGTGLYLRALLYGLFDTDEIKDEEFRKSLQEKERKNGPGYLHAKLQKVDEASAKKIHANDLRRIIRALEVFELTGKPISALQPNRRGLRDEFETRIFWVDRERGDLYERINRRVEQMLSEGLIEVVKRLLGQTLSRTAGMALGIRETGAFLDGRCTLGAATEALKQSTRNYAKRQLSWFRHEKGVERVPVAADEKPIETAEKILKLWGRGHYTENRPEKKSGRFSV